MCATSELIWFAAAVEMRSAADLLRDLRRFCALQGSSSRVLSLLTLLSLFVDSSLLRRWSIE